MDCPGSHHTTGQIAPEIDEIVAPFFTGFRWSNFLVAGFCFERIGANWWQLVTTQAKPLNQWFLDGFRFFPPKKKSAQFLPLNSWFICAILADSVYHFSGSATVLRGAAEQRSKPFWDQGCLYIMADDYQLSLICWVVIFSPLYSKLPRV